MSPSSTGPTRSPSPASGRPPPHEASPLDRRPRPGGHRAHLRPRRVVRRGLPPRDQEGPRAARTHRPEPVLRGEHADAVELRARGQAAERRRRELLGERLERREGRVAEGHRPDAERPQARRDRDPHPVGGRGGARRAVDARRGRQRRRRQARAPDPGAARRLHAAPARRGPRRRLDLDRGRRPAFARRALQRARLPADGREGDRLRPADADPAPHRGARLRRALHARRAAERRRRLRAADAERAHGRGLRSDDPRVRRRVPDQRPPPPAPPGPDAPRPGEPRRRAVGRGRRLAAGRHHDAGRVRDRRADGGALRGARRQSGRAGADAGAVDRMSRGFDPKTALVRAPAAPAELLISRAHVLDPRTGIDAVHDVLVRDGAIAEIGAPGSIEPPPGAEVVDGAGRHLLPAFVDPHVHLRVPGQEHKEDIDTGTRAAAAGGYCAVVAMPNTDPVVDSAPVLRSLRDAAARDARVAVGFMPAITRRLAGSELTEMAELRAEGALGFTDDGKPVVNAGVLRKAIQYQRLAGGVIALHEEDPSLSGRGAMHEGAVSAMLGITGIPSVSESTMIARDAALAGYEDGRVHMQHLSCVESARAIDQAKALGVRVSAEASPHHLCLTDEAIRESQAGPAGFLDTNMKMNPPLRTESDRQALIDGLRSGVIDCIATDHAPHARDEKETPFEQAPMGTTGLETAFAAVHTELVVPGVLSLALIVERMTAGAALLDLPAPRIATGAPANLTLVDLDAEWEVGEDGYESRSENCCFAGRGLRGRVLLTLAGGRVAYRGRGLVAG